MRRFARLWGACLPLCLLLNARPPPAMDGAPPLTASRSNPPLADAEEDALLERFAPVVLLAPGEGALPANVDWFLARVEPDPETAPHARMTQAALLGDLDALVARLRTPAAMLRPRADSRRGSDDRRDWTTYGHVYRAADGGVLVQYWFFYAFNAGHFFFDHEGDWEHVTVRLDAALRPLGAYYARHLWSAPGQWFRWDRLEHEGNHPVVLSARGTHASYADPAEVAWYDSACGDRNPERARDERCGVWRTWDRDTSGGVANMGQRTRPRAGAQFIAWPGHWGAKGWMGRDGGGGPPGPAFQAGWCSGGAAGCT